jgi:putative phosphoribosyl transferase
MKALIDNNQKPTTIQIGRCKLEGLLTLPPKAKGVVIFAHGAGSSYRSPRNKFVADELCKAGFASLLVDLLDEFESADRQNIFCIELLANRLNAIVSWVTRHEELRHLPLGLFGASTGAAAALVSAANSKDTVRAVVCRGGRPDLAGTSLPQVRAATLLIVGSRDEQVLALNRQAFAKLKCEKELQVVLGATHLFPERGALEVVAELAANWFQQHLPRQEIHGSASETTAIDRRLP